MTPRENPIRDQARARARDELGIPSLLLELRHDRGWPDVVFLVHGGRPVLMEFKRPGEPLEPLQAYRADQLRKLNYRVVGPVESADVALGFLRDLTWDR